MIPKKIFLMLPRRLLRRNPLDEGQANRFAGPLEHDAPVGGQNRRLWRFYEPNRAAEALMAVRARRAARGNVKIQKGKFTMNRSGSGLLLQALKTSAVAVALVLWASHGHAQSRPFAGLDGAWSGNGTVSLSDGSSERLRCRAQYKVDNTGLALKQTLRCASDSYKFDLSSDVKSEGDRVSGQWNETNRNIFGSLQGTAGGGRIDVIVEAPGFTASLTLRTSGNKQTVQISSKGDIRGVSITMVKS
jgi:hypothetical protein